MSEPTRYSVEEIECCFQADMVEDSNGEYVSYEDYARLKAEVERLIKAGDNLEQVLTEISYSYRAGNASHERRAAKGGKQS